MLVICLSSALSPVSNIYAKLSLLLAQSTVQLHYTVSSYVVAQVDFMSSGTSAFSAMTMLVGRQEERASGL